MHVYYSDPFTFPLPEKHRFPSEKYRLLRERVERWPASTGVELVLAPRATDGELRLVHEAGYLDGFASGSLGDEAMKRVGFPWSPQLVERSLRSCGGTVAAALAPRAMYHGQPTYRTAVPDHRGYRARGGQPAV